MNDNHWSQYVRMDEPSVNIEACLVSLDWDDDFELGEPWTSDDLTDDE